VGEVEKPTDPIAPGMLFVDARVLPDQLASRTTGQPVGALMRWRPVMGGSAVGAGHYTRNDCGMTQAKLRPITASPNHCLPQSPVDGHRICLSGMFAERRAAERKQKPPADASRPLPVSRGCQWPLGERPFTPCGAPVLKRGPYCEAHTRIAWQRPAAR
jgi:hypothetical protein